MTPQVERELERLQCEASPASARFDSGPPLEGRVVVLPSAFNPPTFAHMHLLEAARQRAAADHALALLTTRNVDKGLFGASLADRVGMLLAAREDSPPFAVGAANQARILDQAAALESTFSDADFDFVVGFDTLERLFAPRYYSDMERELEPFFERHRVWAANRGEIGPAEVSRWIARHAGPFAHAIQVLEIHEAPASLSSTQARDTAHTEDGPAVIPPSVRRYIQRHVLYRE